MITGLISPYFMVAAPSLIRLVSGGPSTGSRDGPHFHLRVVVPLCGPGLQIDFERENARAKGWVSPALLVVFLPDVYGCDRSFGVTDHEEDAFNLLGGKRRLCRITLNA